jgi:hypothetical protein
MVSRAMQGVNAVLLLDNVTLSLSLSLSVSVVHQSLGTDRKLFSSVL